MKKLLVCLLVLFLLVPLMTACNDSDDSNSTTDTENKPNGDTSTSDTSEFVQKTPVKDMEGREFRVLCWDWSAGSNSILGYTGEILYEEEKPSSVDDAKKWVVDQVEEMYNCTITGDKVSDYNNTVVTQVKNQTLAGDEETDYHIVFDSIRNLASLALEGYVLDLNAIDTIDLSASWWDQNAVEDLSINGQVFFTCGDINTYDDQGTWCMLFNKELKETYIPDVDLYGLAKSGKWTWDKFNEIITGTKITNDSNGDGALDEKDTWAFGTEKYNMYVHLVSAGEKMAKKNSDDIPYLTLSEETEKTYDIFGKVLELYLDNNTVLVADNDVYAAKFATSNCWEETVHKAFVEGRELFYMCGLIHAASFRVMEDEFGILPIPKFYDTQDRYYHTVSVGNASAMCIPNGVQDVDDIGTVISAIAELSEHKLTPAYYDVQLKYRDTRDDDSAEMLDLIFSTRTFDLGSAFNWGGLLDHYQQLNKNFASRFESALPAAESKLEEALELIG